MTVTAHPDGHLVVHLPDRRRIEVDDTGLALVYVEGTDEPADSWWLPVGSDDPDAVLDALGDLLKGDTDA